MIQTEKPISYVELSAFCDGALSVTDMERVATALEADSDLRQRMAEIMADRDALRQDETPPPRHGAVEALAARLQTTLDGERRWRQRRQLALLSAGTVALLAIGWVGHTIYVGPVTTPEEIVSLEGADVPIFVADAAGAHDLFSHDSVHPVEFTADDETVMRDWFKTHLGEHATIPHLEELGFNLVGGRLLGDADGATAQLIYRNENEDKVSLFFSKRPVPGGTEVKLVKVGKSFASYWRDDDLTWAVVEDTPGADVSMIADHVSKLPKLSIGE